MSTSGNAPSGPQAAARRRVLTLLAASAAAVVALPAAADLPPLPETDPTAQALGYKADAAQVDAAKYPQHTAQQSCANCKFFQGTGANGPCQLFPGKSVSAKGWCAGYAAKT